MTSKATAVSTRGVRVLGDKTEMTGDLVIPAHPKGLVLFAHGSGSSRLSPRNRYVAKSLNGGGLATLLLDLLTLEEEALDETTGAFRFNIDLLARRVAGATDWVKSRTDLKSLGLGYFGASTGAAAALIAAAERPDFVRAVVSRGGRPDLAKRAMTSVRAPTLLIIGGADEEVIEMNRSAMEKLTGTKKMVIVPGATHLFEEPGALEEVSRLARDWFLKYLPGA